jgi:hypothetical protein
MGYQAAISLKLGSLESEIQFLARDTDTPIETVHAIYHSEFSKLVSALVVAYVGQRFKA